MTVTNHTALYRFTFPTNTSKATTDTPTGQSSYSPLILADLTDLSDSRTNGSISVDPGTGRITGNGTFTPSFGVGTYTLHFCADFHGAGLRDTGVFINNRAGNSTKSLEVFEDGNNSPPLPAGAWVRFNQPDANQLLARVGMSFLSTAQACDNAEKEVKDFDFEGTRSDAEDAWRKKFDVVSVDNAEVPKAIQRIFWSGMYRSMLSPQDYTGMFTPVALGIIAGVLNRDI